MVFRNYSLNGQTFVNNVIPSCGCKEDEPKFLLDLVHFLCGNRKLCVDSIHPITSELSAKLLNCPIDVGNDLYDAEILISGTVTYIPYRCGNQYNQCSCNQCPITDNVWAIVNVPISKENIKEIKLGNVIVEPTNVKDCCRVTNAVSLVTSMQITTSAGGFCGGLSVGKAKAK